MPVRPLRVAVVALAAGAILAATTFPGGPSEPGSLASCIVCGERGAADAIVNVLLFAPLGAALAFARLRARHVILAGALFSGLIETAQLVVIPGRDPSLGDVLFNTIGAAIGVGLFTSAGWWLAPTGFRAAALAWIWSAAVAGVVVGTGILLAPSPTDSLYHGQWTPNLGHLEWYRGQVIEAHLGSAPLPRGRIEDPRLARASLLAGEPVRVRAVVGPPPPGLAPVVAVQDQRQREIVLLGVDRDDLVMRYRTRSSALRLDQPDLRASGAMRGVARGDTMVLAAWRRDGAHCLARDADRRCGIGFTASRGWSILMYFETFPSWLVRLLDFGWLVALFAPLGFWIRDARTLLALLPAGLALLVAPSATSLLPPPPAELALALLAVIGGHALGRSRTRSNGDASSRVRR